MITPCPRCGKQTLTNPVQSGSKWLCFCTSCNKNSGAKRTWNERKQVFEFSIYRLGRRGRGLVLRDIYLEPWMAELAADEIRSYINAGKLVLDNKQ